MCFIKLNQKIKPFEPIFKKEEVSIELEPEEAKIQQLESYYYFPKIYVIPEINIINKEIQIRHQINQAFQGIERNAQQIKFLTEKLQKCEEKVSKICLKMEQLQQAQKLDKLDQKKTSSHISDQEPEQLAFENYESEKKLTISLFGNKLYKYRLALIDEFPSIIYRQRNIKIRVKLISPDGEVLKNDNVINLYLSLCDNKGKWIINNRVGDPMLKGKTSTQLCSGECQFNKIYPQDISRTFLDGQVNIVIYAKSLAVVYDSKLSKSSEKKFINPDFVEPLILENITVKAKKRAE